MNLEFKETKQLKILMIIDLVVAYLVKIMLPMLRSTKHKIFH